jgi:hypothetical protein
LSEPFVPDRFRAAIFDRKAWIVSTTAFPCATGRLRSNPTRDAEGEADPEPEGRRSRALWAVQTVDQVTQPGGGLKAKVDMKQRLVACELADRLRLVALS